MEFKLGELFCGPGGIAKGALTANIGCEEWRIVHAWANDFDASTCETYRKNICPDYPESVICEDVHTLDIDSLGEIDALAFVAPCNDYSIVGKKKGFDGKYGPLYSYGIKALLKYKPYWFVFENVSGIKSANDGKAFEIIQNDMRKAGYKLYPILYHFEQYGIPQARHRMIIVGIRDDLPYEFKIPSYKGYDIKTCREAIEIPPIPFDAANNEKTKQSKIVVERLKHIKAGENARNADLPDELKLNVNGTKLSQIYKRLDPDRPSYTITGSGGGGTHVYHWSEPRALTNRERARLQTFPDDYVFSGNKENVRRQIGMAVPVEGARIIFEAILKTLEKLTDVNRPVANVTQWCKRVACWDSLQTMTYELPESIEDCLISFEDREAQKKSSNKDQKVIKGINAQAEVVKLPAEHWKRLSEFAVVNHLVTASDVAALKIACQLPVKIPNSVQSQHLLNLEEKARKEGFKSED